MKVINTYKQDGYLITEYDTGAIVKELISDDILEENFDNNLSNQLTDDELEKLQLKSDIEYIKCLLETNLNL